MNVSPMISIYMPTKNRSGLLKRAIESVMTQDYPSFELIVVDDGSSDDTPQVLADYAEKYTNFRYFRNEQSAGAAAARNLAVENAQGEFVTGLDDDDYFLQGRLNSLMSAYDDKYAFVCSSVIWDWGDRRKLADHKAMVFTLEQQLSYNYATTQILVRKQRLLAVGGFDTGLSARIDYDAWTCLMEKYGDALRINPASYVLWREEGLERITSSKRNIEGNLQFLNKHRDKMNRHNLNNQVFWDLYARQAPFGLIQLIRQLPSGLIGIKLRYFVRINFLRRMRS